MKLINIKNQSGFTIVELMIALSVLSILLIAAAVVMIDVGSLYTKGVNASDLQNTNRNIVSDIVSEIQFSGSPPSCLTPIPSNSSCQQVTGGMTVDSFCVNDTLYTYTTQREQGTDSPPGQPSVITNHVLWKSTAPNDSSCSPVGGFVTGTPSSGYDMVPNHMRITNFSVTNTAPNVYTVDIAMAYGDSDLLLASGDGTHCSGNTGTQYCATSDIQESVTQRLN